MVDIDRSRDIEAPPSIPGQRGIMLLSHGARVVVLPHPSIVKTPIRGIPVKNSPPHKNSPLVCPKSVTRGGILSRGNPAVGRKILGFYL